MSIRKLSLVLLFSTFSSWGICQKIGLVLSGGGATGLAHIGVLKALEENGISIDYITGTSAGAMVGGLYAAGYSPEEIEALVLSDKFLYMAQGKIEDKFIYYFKEPSLDPSWIRLRFSPDSIKYTTLPTNLVTPTLMDFEMMAGLTSVSAATEYDFNKLFVPFRCVASDIVEKKSVIFKSGNLNEAIRVSMTYPFYFKPIRVDGKLLFDGGMYNNFPADIMYEDFLPDVIIGSNVSGNVKAPDGEDLRSQLLNMIVVQQDFTLQCENGIILYPNPDISTFDFTETKKAIQSGYETTIANMDSIKKIIGNSVTKEEIQKRRSEFKSKLPEVEFTRINITGLNKRQSEFVRKTIIDKKDSSISLEELKPKYFRIYNDERISSIFPHSHYNPITKSFDLNLEIKKDKDFEVYFGGNFSSQPINSGFLGLNYHVLRKSAWTFSASSSFGKLYSSGRLAGKFEPPTRLPFYLEAEFVLHRWDFYRSFATFFEDIKPSYIIQEEQYASGSLGFPIKNRSRFIIYGRYADLSDRYYQVENFRSTDTSDVTRVFATSGGFYLERSTLNRKQFASEGTYLYLGAKYNYTQEYSIPGSTSIVRDTTLDYHSFPVFKLEYQNYFKRKGNFKFGFHTEGVLSFQDFYSNYIASVLSAPSYQPIPHMKSIFLPDFRAYQYVSGGLQMIVNIKNFDLRFEGYVFQPLLSIRANEFNQAIFSDYLEERYFIGSSSLIYHSPLGPVSLSLNYYHEQEQPFYFLFNFGYIIFNKTAIR
jgi:NTE family protein